MPLDDYKQIAYEFAKNPEPRCPVLLLLDVSASMRGEKLAQLNRGLETFQKDLRQDSLASARCEIAIVTFGPVQIVSEFTNAQNFQVPRLQLGQRTPLGGAVIQGLELLQDFKEKIRLGGIGLYRPWVFLVTDGAPTDNWQVAAQAIKQGEENHSFCFFPVGVSGANMQLLSQLSQRQPLEMNSLQFNELFLWLSSSLKYVAHSTIDQQKGLTLPSSWTRL